MTAAKGTFRLAYHLLWPVEDSAALLPPEVVERLTPYITRYAQTLGGTVHAVGGVADHLHVVLNASHERSLAEVNDELRRASARFVRDVLGVSGFAWDGAAQSLSTLSPDAVVDAASYVTEQAARHSSGDLRAEWEPGAPPQEAAPEEALPDWLREVVGRRE